MSARIPKTMVCALAIGLALAVSAAVAQTQPRAGDTGTPPNGNVPPNVTAAPQMPLPPPPMDGGFRPTWYPETYFSGNYRSGYPAPEVQAVPAAMANAAVAEASYRRAQNNIGLMIIQMRKLWERSRDWVAALNEEREAYDAMEAVRRQTLRTLADDPGYQASVSLRDSMTKQIEVRRQDKAVKPEEILAMARVKMDYASTASAMEAAALAASPDYQQARERLRRASTQLSELRFQFDQNVLLNPDMIAARQIASDMRIASVGAEVYLAGVREARYIALRYSYWAGRYDKYMYLNQSAWGANWWGGSWGGFPIYWNQPGRW